MPIEIERRFVVLKMDDEMEKYLRKVPPSLSFSSYIQQGYFGSSSELEQLRIRIVNNSRAWVTFKKGMGISREEDEYELSDLKFAIFLFNHCAYTLRKTRWLFPANKCELDIYHGPLGGLIVAEFELSSPEEPIVMPHFLWETKEVTDSLTNLHLARMATELESKVNNDNTSIMAEILRRTKKLPVIVITGGPCSGKSTIMTRLKESPKIHCVPEVATILISLVGIDPKIDINRFQDAVYGVQKIFEITSLGQAIDKQKRALVTDRGSMDNAAYFKGGVNELTYFLKTTVDYEYSRYNLVVCLEIPNRETYEKEKMNNPARGETYEQALELQRKTIDAWRRHPNFRIVKNRAGWAEKEKEVTELVKKFIEH